MFRRIDVLVAGRKSRLLPHRLVELTCTTMASSATLPWSGGFVELLSFLSSFSLSISAFKWKSAMRLHASYLIAFHRFSWGGCIYVSSLSFDTLYQIFPVLTTFHLHSTHKLVLTEWKSHCLGGLATDFSSSASKILSETSTRCFQSHLWIQSSRH